MASEVTISPTVREHLEQLNGSGNFCGGKWTVNVSRQDPSSELIDSGEVVDIRRWDQELANYRWFLASNSTDRCGSGNGNQITGNWKN